MATYYKANVKKVIPITYICNECGKNNMDGTIVSAQGQVQAAFLRDNSGDATTAAQKNLSYKINAFVNEVNMMQKCGNLTSLGKCSCGYTQPWATGKIRTVAKKISTILGILLFLGLSVYWIIKRHIWGTVIIAFFAGMLLTAILNGLMVFVYKIIASKGVAKMKAAGKQDCLPRIPIRQEMPEN